jgi:hypothetical protein
MASWQAVIKHFFVCLKIPTVPLSENLNFCFQNYPKHRNKALLWKLIFKIFTTPVIYEEFHLLGFNTV